jgi:hypothetical protein
VGLEVGAQEGDQGGRDGDGPDFVGGAVFEAAGLAGGGGVLEVGEEPVGEGLGGEGFAVLAAGDGPPDPPAAFGGVADLLDVPEFRL